MKLSDRVEIISGVGGVFAQRLDKLGVESVGDLINHFPRRYIDYGKPKKIFELKKGEMASVRAKLEKLNIFKSKKGKWIISAKFYDGTGYMPAVWFNQIYLNKILKEGEEYMLAGEVDWEWTSKKLGMTSPELESAERGGKNTTGMVPVYPQTAGVSSKWLRQKMDVVVKSVEVEEILPEWMIVGADVIERDKAYKWIHQPNNEKEVKSAERRLAFEDLLDIELKSELSRRMWREKSAPKIEMKRELLDEFLKGLEFELTDDQKRAIEEILADMERGFPMNRLLQGEVGSGKTVVAAAAILESVKNGKKAVVMAPTQVLAQQHAITLDKFLNKFGVKTEVVMSGKKAGEDWDLLVGTHALLFSDDLMDDSIGLVVVDEQHRFGVAQRAHFVKKQKMAHVLTMSATPIPRTVALFLHGHLEMSLLKTMPSKRKEVKTWLVEEKKRKDGFEWVGKQIEAGDQVFVVCPLIDPSESETMKDVKAASAVFEKLKKGQLKKYRLGLLHGRMNMAEKEEILNKFRDGEIDALVSTPVIEVGIDVPNATVMVIEAAERFGLAQLHQLRGRVGRGEKQSYCLLFSSSEDPETNERLKLMEKFNNGLDLAKMDLKIRGAGEVFGTAQSGHLDTRFAWFWSKRLREKARESAITMVEKDEREARKLLNSFNSLVANLEART